MNTHNGDDVYYYIEWGEYSNAGEWIGPYSSGEQIILTHTWDKGTYTIKAKAKDVYDQESEWGYLEVSVPLNQPSSQQFTSESNPQITPSSQQSTPESNPQSTPDSQPASPTSTTSSTPTNR